MIPCWQAFLGILAGVYLGRYLGRKEGRAEVREKFSLVQGGRSTSWLHRR